MALGDDEVAEPFEIERTVHGALDDDVAPVAVVASRAQAQAGAGGDQRIPVPEGEWTDLLADRSLTVDAEGVEVTAVLAGRPVALLVRAEASDQPTTGEDHS